MLRILMAGLLTLMAAACNYGSDVDLAPLNERIPKRIVSTGDYCEATAVQPPYTVTSSGDCLRLEWRQATRTYMVFDNHDDGEPGEAAVARISQSLYLAQVVDTDDAVNGRYKISLAVVAGNAFLYLPRLKDEQLADLIARHPRVTLRTDGSDPVITDGSRADIKAFLRDSATETLRGVNLDDEEMAVAVRDTAGSPDHPATAIQTRDINDLRIALRRLQNGG